jgi:hypothetical protein
MRVGTAAAAGRLRDRHTGPQVRLGAPDVVERATGVASTGPPRVMGAAMGAAGRRDRALARARGTLATNFGMGRPAQATRRRLRAVQAGIGREERLSAAAAGLEAPHSARTTAGMPARAGARAARTIWIETAGLAELGTAANRAIERVHDTAANRPIEPVHSTASSRALGVVLGTAIRGAMAGALDTASSRALEVVLGTAIRGAMAAVLDTASSRALEAGLGTATREAMAAVLGTASSRAVEVAPRMGTGKVAAAVLRIGTGKVTRERPSTETEKVGREVPGMACHKAPQGNGATGRSGPVPRLLGMDRRPRVTAATNVRTPVAVV